MEHLLFLATPSKAINAYLLSQELRAPAGTTADQLNLASDRCGLVSSAVGSGSLPSGAERVSAARTVVIGVVEMRLTAAMSLPRRPSSAAHARHILETLLGLTAASHDDRGHLALLLTEAVANAVQHADSGCAVDLAITIEDDECLIEVGNRGEAPGPAALATGQSAPLTTIGGRGLPLSAALSDTAAFVPTLPGRVLLRMSKRLLGGPSFREPCGG